MVNDKKLILRINLHYTTCIWLYAFVTFTSLTVRWLYCLRLHLAVFQPQWRHTYTFSTNFHFNLVSHFIVCFVMDFTSIKSTSFHTWCENTCVRDDCKFDIKHLSMFYMMLMLSCGWFHYRCILKRKMMRYFQKKFQFERQATFRNVRRKTSRQRIWNDMTDTQFHIVCKNLPV